MKSIKKNKPQRSCAACHTVHDKGELIRLVHLPDNGVEIDPTGKKAGRGAYLCRNLECWQAGLKQKRLDHSLRFNLNEDSRERLLRELGEMFPRRTIDQTI